MYTISVSGDDEGRAALARRFLEIAVALEVTDEGKELPQASQSTSEPDESLSEPDQYESEWAPGWKMAKVYQYLVDHGQHKGVTKETIANKFDISVEGARWHLTQLESHGWAFQGTPGRYRPVLDEESEDSEEADAASSES